MQHLIFADLDDTFFQTLRKCGDFALADKQGALQARAYLQCGEAISYATPKQQHLWQWLSSSAQIIPVTARNYDAFLRVDLSFHDEVVLNHGAVILNRHRELDGEWLAYMTDSLPPYHQDLFDLWQSIEAFCQYQVGYKPRIIEDFGQAWYIVIKHEQPTKAETELQILLDQVVSLHEAVQQQRLYWHFNGNNLAILPTIVAKSHAVQFLLNRYADHFPAIFSIGIGDSKTDLPFMALCDYAMVPQQTQLGAILHAI